MPIRITLIFTASLARPSAPGTNTVDHSKALIKNQLDSIEGHKRTAQDLLKLGQRDEAISIIEQLIQRNNPSKQQAWPASSSKCQGKHHEALFSQHNAPKQATQLMKISCNGSATYSHTYRLISDYPNRALKY